MKRTRARPLAAGLAILVAACASAPASKPRPVTEGEEQVTILAYERAVEADREGMPRVHNANVRQVVCTIRNDKGTWTTTTGRSIPETITVQRSSEPFVVECAREGFHTIGTSYQCVGQQQLQLSGPEAVLVLGVASAFLLPGGVNLVAQGMTAERCMPRTIMVPMLRASESGRPSEGWHLVTR